MASNKGSKFLPIVVVMVLALVGAGVFIFSQVGISDGKGGRTVLDLKTGRVKTVTVDADLASDTLNTIAINSADIKDKFKGVDETIVVQQQQMREMAETLKQLNQTNQALKEQLEQQNRKMASVEDAVSNTATIDADSIKASILKGLKENFSEFIPGSMNTLSKNETEYSITDKTTKQA